jgi:hypothetical protein
MQDVLLGGEPMNSTCAQTNDRHYHTITYAIREATGRTFCPTQPPLGLGRRWGGLKVVGGVQLGT